MPARRRAAQLSLQLLWFLPRLYLPLLIAVCFALAWRPITGGSDFWAHAAVGRWIAGHHQVPQRTLFLWGDSQPWIAHSWLSQVWFYTLLHLGGEDGGARLALIFTGVMTPLTLGLLWRAWAQRGRVSLLTPMFFALALWCGGARMSPRPELFSGLFFVVTLVFLLNFERERKISPRQLVGLLLMFVLWANFHGGVASGLLLIGLTLVADVVQERVESGRWRYSPLLALLILCALAVCINPYGPRYYIALSPVGGAMFAHIDEWKPFWKWPASDPFFPIAGATLMLFALLSWGGNAQRRWAYGAWVIVWALLFLSARRHLWMLCLVCLAVMAINNSSIDSRRFLAALRGGDSEENREALSQVVMLLRLGLVVFLAFITAQLTPSSLLESWPPRATSRYLPRQAAIRLKNLGVGKRVLNDYETSSYLQWRCAGQPPLYIDLLNAYQARLLFDYFDIMQGKPRGKVLLHDLKINCVFLRRHDMSKMMRTFISSLDKQPEWRRAYQDANGIIWLRRVTVTPASAKRASTPRTLSSRRSTR